MALTWPQGRKRLPINLGGQFATLEGLESPMKQSNPISIGIL
jgi:hypothetical protein